MAWAVGFYSIYISIFDLFGSQCLIENIKNVEIMVLVFLYPPNTMLL